MATVAQIERAKCVISGPLSRTTTYALHMTGPVNVHEIDNLIRVLQLHREWLAQDEAEATTPGP